MDLQIPKLADLQMDNELDNASEMPADLPWQLLEEITNDFSEERKIGSGGYGVVYKGVYKNGEEIAVKKFYHMPGLDDNQFQNELQNLTRLRHQNIVRLVGKCYEERERCVEYKDKLVYAKMIDRVICLEYLHNGSLQKHLCDESSGLPWHKRYKIIKGICDGLKYLHECGIFHLDLKPSNILLDENMETKIADFGLSRLFSGTRQSHTTSKILGTLGYVPPEYIEKGKITEKFDVFSLGGIIIRIMTGPDGYSKHSDMSSQDFIEQVLQKWRNRPQEQWKAESYFSVYCQQVKICIEIALNCVETDRHKRPTIGDIICRLNELETMIEKYEGCSILPLEFFSTIDVHPTEPWILRPVLKGAPFVVCSNCFKLVQVPAYFTVPSKSVRELRCGSCSAILSYTYRDPDRKKHQQSIDQYSTDGSEVHGKGFGHGASYSTEDEQPLHVSRNSSFNTVDAINGVELQYSPDLYESFDKRTTPDAGQYDRKGNGVCVDVVDDDDDSDEEDSGGLKEIKRERSWLATARDTQQGDSRTGSHQDQVIAQETRIYCREGLICYE